MVQPCPTVGVGLIYRYMGMETDAMFLYVPMIQNTMPKNAFVAVRRFLHFVRDNQKVNKKSPQYDPIYKVRP